MSNTLALKAVADFGLFCFFWVWCIWCNCCNALAELLHQLQTKKRGNYYPITGCSKLSRARKENNNPPEFL